MRVSAIRRELIACVFALTLASVLCPLLRAELSHGSVATVTTEDPNKAPSEFNHHVAGFALMGIGVLVLAARISPRASRFEIIWPILFILAGLFLAAWSDAEMWPRGNLSWLWLLHHDREARQHKVYALLLIAIGAIEYLRIRGRLGRFWRVWAFPILAVVGAGLLLVHDHTVGSGTKSPEVRAYLINPALNPDGKPWPAGTLKGQALDPQPAQQPEALLRADPAGQPAPKPAHPEDPGITSTAHDSSVMDHSTMQMDHSTMQMDHSAMTSDSDPSSTSGAHEHHHHMTPAMLLVAREHFSFMVVGIAIALLKLASDAGLWPRRQFLNCMWPSAVIVLGVLLTLYHE